MQSREFKNAVFEQFARVASAFASPRRIELIDILAQGERNVETLAGEANLSVANTSQHLGVLKSASLVSSRKEGLQVIYRLADSRVLAGYRALQAVAEERLSELGRLVQVYFDDVEGLETVDGKELLTRARSGEVVVIDVRPGEEYAAGHIEGALSVPLSHLEQYLSGLRPEQKVVVYCRGPYCVLAAEAVKTMRARGYRAFRFAEGYPEWRDAGLPVDSAAAG
jgi:rhodanese-related sulfurtransferase/DNA-binding transcriptional ArsR family regulator